MTRVKDSQYGQVKVVEEKKSWVMRWWNYVVHKTLCKWKTSIRNATISSGPLSSVLIDSSSSGRTRCKHSINRNSITLKLYTSLPKMTLRTLVSSSLSKHVTFICRNISKTICIRKSMSIWKLLETTRSSNLTINRQV